MHRPGMLGRTRSLSIAMLYRWWHRNRVAITGAYVALADAVTYLSAAGVVRTPGHCRAPSPRSASVLSTAWIRGSAHEEDSRAEVEQERRRYRHRNPGRDSSAPREGATFARSTPDKLPGHGTGLATLFAAQRDALCRWVWLSESPTPKAFTPDRAARCRAER